VRLIRLTTVYPSYLTGFYGTRPGLSERTYAEQHERMVYDAFGWADFWTNALSGHGYEIWEPIANAEPMQRAWAIENGVPSNSAGWMYEITLAQAKAFYPDVVFIDDYGAFDSGFVRHLRSTVPSIRLVLGWCAAPYSDESVFSHYDVLLTSIPGVARYFQSKGHHAEVLMHAFDPRILGRLNSESQKRHSLTFLGSVRPGEPHLKERQDLLMQLWVGGLLEVFADVAMPPTHRGGLLGRFRNLLEGNTGARRSSGRSSAAASADWEAFASAAKPARFGLEMFQTLRDSEATFNAHSGFFGESASNMRLYEATGVGTCLLTEHKQNLRELFRPDIEVVVYRSVPECLEKARWLRDHPVERNAIARAGQQRTLRDHTFERRVEILVDVIQRSLKQTGP
jgi:spore maturation protein CgeB